MAKQDTAASVADNLPTFDNFDADSLRQAVQTQDDPIENPEEDPEEEPAEEPEKPAKVGGVKKPSKSSLKNDDEPNEPGEEEEEPEEEEEEEESEDDESGTSFWDDVESLTGQKVEVDYGDTDPESPEGAVIREHAIRQQTQNEVIDFIKVNHPDVHMALSHAMNGGDVRELFIDQDRDWSKIQLDENNIDGLKQFILEDMEQKGIERKIANKVIEAGEDEDNLFEMAQKALAEKVKTQKLQNQRRDQELQQHRQMIQQSNQNLIGEVNKIINDGKLNSFTVAKQERDDFSQFAVSHMQSDGKGGHLIVLPVDKNNLEAQLQQLFFIKKKGDLSSIIQRAATTAKTNKLKSKAAKAKEESAREGDTEQKEQRARAAKQKKTDDLPTFEDYGL